MSNISGRSHHRWHPGRNGLSWSIGYWWSSRKCTDCGLIKYTWRQLRIFFTPTGKGGWVRSHPVKKDRGGPYPLDNTVFALTGKPTIEFRILNEEPERECQCLRKWRRFHYPPQPPCNPTVSIKEPPRINAKPRRRL